MASVLDGENFVAQNMELFGFYEGNILVQIVKELLDNSYDAVGSENKNAFITVTILVEENYVVINVVDNGRGISNPHLCFSCFHSEIHQDTRIGKYGMGLTVSSFYAFSASQVPILLASRNEETQNILRYEIQFLGTSPIITILPDVDNANDFSEEIGAMIQLKIPQMNIDINNEIISIYEYAAKMLYGANFALTIEINQAKETENRVTRISNPRIILCHSDEEIIVSSMAWLSETLPQYEFLHFEMAKIENHEKHFQIEVHSIACISRNPVNPSQLASDCTEFMIPLKVWAYINGKPLDGSIDCLITEQIRFLPKLPSHIRITEGKQIGEILAVRSRKVKDFWSAEIDQLSYQSCIIVVLKINSETVAFQDLRKKSVVRLDDSICSSIQIAARKSLLSLISSSFLNSLFVDAKNMRDKYMDHIGAQTIARSLTKWLTATQDEESRQHWIQELGATSPEKAQELLKYMLLKK